MYICMKYWYQNSRYAWNWVNRKNQISKRLSLEILMSKVKSRKEIFRKNTFRIFCYRKVLIEMKLDRKISFRKEYLQNYQLSIFFSIEIFVLEIFSLELPFSRNKNVRTAFHSKKKYLTCLFFENLYLYYFINPAYVVLNMQIVGCPRPFSYRKGGVTLVRILQQQYNPLYDPCLF